MEMEMMNGVYVKVMNKVAEWKNEEKGSQTLEWLGIAAVVVILVGVISQVFSGNQSIGNDVKNKFTDFISKIGGN
jgi:Flp pilus assembly pilin Flp